MAGYIGSKASVTQVDGYNTTEADAEFVNDPNGVITVDGGNVGIGTSSPSQPLEVNGFVRLGDEAGSILDIRGSATSADGILISSTYYGSGGFGPIKFNTSNSEAMRIDSAGRVTMPYQPAFMAKCNTNGNSALTDGTVANFDNAVVNVGGHYSTTSKAFTAPVAGRYKFEAQILSNNGSRLFYHFRKNNAQVDGTRIETHSQSGSYSTGTSTVILDLAVNDSVTVFMNSDGYGGAYSSWNGFLIG